MSKMLPYFKRKLGLLSGWFMYL